MKQVIAWYFCMVIILAVVFQPFAAEVHHLKRMIVEQSLAKEMNQAILEGHFSEDRIETLRENLSRWLLVDESKIHIEGTTELQEKGNPIEARVEVEVTSMWLFGPFFGQPERDRIRAYMVARSEYIPGISGGPATTEG